MAGLGPAIHVDARNNPGMTNWGRSDRV